MQHWLKEAALHLRGAETKEQVAAWAGVSYSTINLFETKATVPREIDRILAAYAIAGGLDDPRDVLLVAHGLWTLHGSMPQLPNAEALPTRPFKPDTNGIGEALREAEQALRRLRSAEENQAQPDQGLRQAGGRGKR